ncbi:lysozyme [Burkholderia cepacia]|uniref:lysozyme n=1 Tax=Burkholderia cepacia TaxID=292 RepID=UPI0015751532|nr:lysozyme [Burkholderia cepacia]
MNMTYSKTGLQLTESFEGCVLNAYPDPASPLGKELQRRGLWKQTLAGVPIPADLLNKLNGAPWTIGYGHTGPEVRYGLVWTQAQAEAALMKDVQGAVGAVNRLVKVPLSQCQFDALVDFVFNLGETRFAGSTMLRLLNAGLYEAAANEFQKWDMAGGVHVAGLLRRRQAEAREFRCEVPA